MLRSRRSWVALTALSGILCTWMLGLAWGQEHSTEYGLGRSPSEQEIRAWDIDVVPTGEGLPLGRGTVQKGRQIYLKKCASCHGKTGVEGPRNKLVGGRGSLRSDKPLKTVGSYWPYATTLYDYIQRAMPITAPQSLTPNEVYSLVAWILYRNAIISEDVVIDRDSLPTVRMPNVGGFVPDPRPDVPRK